ncbi:class I SAM-dependent methyltransferase [Kaarinaea lacus]
MVENDASPHAVVAVWATDTALQPIAQSIADNLLLPLASTSRSLPERQNNDYPLMLVITPNETCGFQIELHDSDQKNVRLLIDYASGEIAYRAKHGGGRKQALAKAIGLKPGYSPNVIDATAGLGRDAFVLAYLGCHVQMIERSPIIACLLEDALRRAAYDEHLKSWINQRLQLIIGDAFEQIPQLCNSSSVEVIYIDPMYPPRNKSALVKKEMRFIQAVVGKDFDSAALLTVARQNAKKRVVVKRPSYATALAGEKPNHTIESKNTRYDVYMTD